MSDPLCTSSGPDEDEGEAGLSSLVIIQPTVVSVDIVKVHAEELSYVRETRLMGQLDNDKATARAQKAKATRIENACREALENERLAKETEQPRGAKTRALSNHVWLGNKETQGTPESNKRAASPDEAESAVPSKQRRKDFQGAKVAVRDMYKEKEGSEKAMTLTVATKIRKRAPTAAIIPSDSEPEAEKLVSTKKDKKIQKTKCAESESDDSDDESSGPEVGKSDADDESSGSDDDQLTGRKIDEKSLTDRLNQECPVLGADNDDEEEELMNLFDLPDDDVEMASVRSSRNSRSSSLASRPPTTDSEDL
ncbi:hypothetical protein K443DRAFT_126739, partial [Laccaria amethystina LaAM-08-1]